MKAGVHPREGRDLSALTALGSTGSALSPEGFDWVYARARPRHLAGFGQRRHRHRGPVPRPVPWLPVYRAELQGRALGVAVESWDPQGRRWSAPPGSSWSRSRCRRCRWRSGATPTARRYREAYFQVYPGVWRHGDWLEITEHGGGILYGRSDATINRGGVRMGPPSSTGRC